VQCDCPVALFTRVCTLVTSTIRGAWEFLNRGFQKLRSWGANIVLLVLNKIKLRVPWFEVGLAKSREVGTFFSSLWKEMRKGANGLLKFASYVGFPGKRRAKTGHRRCHRYCGCRQVGVLEKVKTGFFQCIQGARGLWKNGANRVGKLREKCIQVCTQAKSWCLRVIAGTWPGQKLECFIHKLKSWMPCAHVSRYPFSLL
jgi:hypothetical protein